MDMRRWLESTGAGLKRRRCRVRGVGGLVLRRRRRKKTVTQIHTGDSHIPPKNIHYCASSWGWRGALALQPLAWLWAQTGCKSGHSLGCSQQQKAKGKHPQYALAVPRAEGGTDLA